MIIRVATADDLDYVLECLSSIFLYEEEIRKDIKSPSEEFILKNKALILEQLENKNYLFLIWQVDSQDVWFLSGRMGDTPRVWSYERFSHIEAVFIKEEYRKHWFAKKLCENFFDWARQKWSDRVLLDVLDENVDARGLYEGLWFGIHIHTLAKNI